jgi:glutamate--cysteine ligase
MIPDLHEPVTHVLPSGSKIVLEPLIREGDRVGVEGYFPCCIILNNDLSAGVPEIFNNTKQFFMPPFHLGWSTRLKSSHFRAYDAVCASFSTVVDLDPWLINPYFDHCGEVDFSSAESLACLTDSAADLFKKIRQKYAEYKIDRNPFLVVKADQGTYGMAVMMIQDPSELLQLNRKQRTKMAASKGGNPVTKAIMQEGVYTFETVEEAVAEPVVYHIGRYVVGGFYRIHKNRGVDENLNAPGMDFQSLAFAKNCHIPPNQKCEFKEPVNRFYAYGVVSRLAMLAAARE